MTRPARRLVNLDLDLVRAFLAVAELGSFTAAAARVGRSQSAVSLQIRRLEAQLRVSLFERDQRGAVCTADGEALLAPARRLLRLNDEIVEGLAGEALEGAVRFGAPEDFATMHLPKVLGDFTRAYPQVRLTVTCDLTLNLLDGLRRGDLDLVLIKREPLGPDLGVRVWREPLVWVAAEREVLTRGPALPLIAAPAPCVYRRRAIAALETIARPWRHAYTSPSLAGQLAALRAGLGVMVSPKDMAPPGLVLLGERDGLPALADAELALLRAPGGAPPAADRLAEAIRSALGRGGVEPGGAITSG